jgi:outer membrane protein OmpA-like peptidoglycan-associated protein
MKFFLVIISFFLCQTIQSQTLTGLWQGKLTQESGGVLENYYFEMQLLNEKDSIKGVSFVAVSKKSQAKGKMRIEGTFKNKEFSFEEFELPQLKGELINRSSFCQKKATLNYIQGKQQNKLEGNWEGKIDSYGNCSPGKISLVQISSQKPILLNLDLIKKQVDNSQNNKKEVKKIIFEGKSIEKGQSIILEDITFEATKHTIKNQKSLEKLTKLMQENPKLIIELSGHTDKNPPKTHPNYEKIAWQHLALSQKRVEEVARYLMSKGIEKERIHTLAHGGTQPLSQDSAKNRRVEMKVVEY